MDTLSKRILPLIFILALALGGCYPPTTREPAPPTPTREPLIPTVPVGAPAGSPVPSPAPLATRPRAEASPTGAARPSSPGLEFGGSARSRICVALPLGGIMDYDWEGALPGWWLNWNVLSEPPTNPPFAQMVRVPKGALRPSPAAVTAAARANPGALWLVGNEMDVAWQDNATPEQYARAYRQAYEAIKKGDPSAQVAIGGVSQPTPLRLDYLDRVLAAYRSQTGRDMPVDVWNVHAFILREERDSWGVGIPPGMSEDRGVLREIADHADMKLFEEQIVAFRMWMDERGFRDKPLIVSEYGLLMPAEYGFPPEAVARFLTATFDYFLSAKDAETGYPRDGNRLVQAFCWYSAADTVYPTPNLFDPASRLLTQVGEAYRDYVGNLRDRP